MRPTVSQVLAMSKSQLEQLLAKNRCSQYPSLYAGHEDDAVKYVRNCLGTTRKELLLSIACLALVSADHGGIPEPGWHDEQRRAK